MIATITDEGQLKDVSSVDNVKIQTNPSDSMYLVVHDTNSGEIHIFSDLIGSVEVVRLNRAAEESVRLSVQKV